MSRTLAPPSTLPVRYGSRYGSGRVDAAHRCCLVCTTALPSPRARYCSDVCKQRAYRLRQVAPTAVDATTLAATLKRLGEIAAHTIYECPTCDVRYLGNAAARTATASAGHWASAGYAGTVTRRC